MIRCVSVPTRFLLQRPKQTRLQETSNPITIDGMKTGRDLKGVPEAPPQFDMHRAKLNVVEIQVVTCGQSTFPHDD